MKRSYRKRGTRESRRLAGLLVGKGQILLPFVELVERSSVAVETVLDVVGRAAIEGVLLLSAKRVAGTKRPGRAKRGEVCWYGFQPGRVRLSDRKLRVERPRLRRRGAGAGGEVPVPAYEALQAAGPLGERVLEILMAGVSTRRYERVVPEIAETVGISKSSISREFVEASGEELRRLAERRFEGLDLLVIYLDGVRFGEHHVIAAVGVDGEGKKHVLGIREGATENTAVVHALLEDLVERGLDPRRPRLYVIDGSKALRRAVRQVFGRRVLVQRCRGHKIRNVVDHLPVHLRPQVQAAMRAAYRLGASEGMARLERQATWLDKEQPSAAASLREGLEETFTVARLGLSSGLARCLTTTNIIENSHSGLRQRTRRVTQWQNGEMVARWAAAALLDAEKSYRKILGYRDLWQLDAVLNNLDREGEAKVA